MTSQIVINDLLVSYVHHHATQDTKENLIFLHGWRSNKESWEPVIQGLQKLPWNIYVLDLPGFGQSSTPARPYALDDYRTVVEKFIQKMELSSVVLVGHSFGGRISIKIASGEPDFLRKVVLVDSAGFVLPSGKKGFMQVVAKTVKPLFRPGFMQPLRKKIYQKIGSEDYLATPELRETFLNVLNEDLTNYLPKIKVPALLIWGDRDRDTPLEYARRMHQRIPESKLVVLEGAGHYSFLDQPEKFLKELSLFLS